MRKTIAILLVLLSIDTITLAYDWNTNPGDGLSEGTAYQISMAEQLVSIGSDPNLLDKHFVLMNDIDLDPNVTGMVVFATALIAPDTDGSNPDSWNFDGITFAGAFDGAGFKIVNLTINASGTSNEFLGLFGCVDTEGEVRNLEMKNVTITGGYASVGALVGSNLGSIHSCYTTGSVSSGYQIGGLVGDNAGSIDGCCATGSVAGYSNYNGGLVGFNTGSIHNSYANASVTGPWTVGGLVGENRWTISNCYSHGAASAEGSSSPVGGLVGINTGNVDNCYSIGQVSCGDNASDLGGLVGVNHYDGIITNCYWNIDTADANISAGGFGRTTTQMQIAATYIGWGGSVWTIDEGNDYPRLLWEDAGGIVIDNVLPRTYNGSGTEADPFILTTAEDIYNMAGRPEDWSSHFILAGDIDMSLIEGYQPPSNFTGTLDGRGYKITGLRINEATSFLGLIGYLREGGRICDLGLENVQIIGYRHVGGLAGASYRGKIERCYSSGDVTGMDHSQSLGGLVGYTYGGLVDSCYARGSVTGGNDSFYVGGLVGYNYASCIINHCYTTSNVSTGNGSVYIGGLAGTNCGGDIYYSYSIGPVTSGSDSSDVGGLIGGNYNSNVVSNCYWDTDASGIDYSDGGFGRTTEQMRAAATYIGWEAGIWTIDEGNDYPHLLWEGIDGNPIDNIPVRTYSGSGTAIDPFILTQAQDLYCLSCRPGDWNNHFVLADNIDMSAVLGYQPPVDFRGVIDGGGWVISGLKIHERTSFLGLVGYLGSGGTIRNLGLVGLDIQGYRSVGGLVGCNHSGKVERCYSRGTIVGADNSEYLGGVVGSNDSGDIENSHSDCELTTGFNSRYIGGLVGGNLYHTRIDNCYSANAVTVGDYSECLGGLVGYSWYGDINDCYSECFLTGGMNLAYIGGLVGQAGYETHINKCYAANVITLGDYTSYLGGLLGYKYYNCTITSSFWDVQASGQLTSAGGEGKTTTEMQTMSTFTDAGWDFVGEDVNGIEDIWMMYGDGVSYPKLWWEFIIYDNVIYVDASASAGNNDGSSWADAYTQLQLALDDAATSGKDIWVAKGKYIPDTTGLADPREATFQLINGVGLYGGFSSGGSIWEERDPNMHETILSGDLASNDCKVDNPVDLLDDPNRVENSYHVVTGSWTDSTAILDGFMIRGGNAYFKTDSSGSSTLFRGGGMYTEHGSPKLFNCIFNENLAGWKKEHDSGGYSLSGGGAGMYNFQSTITLTHCRFICNVSRTSGGGIINDESEVTLNYCTFNDNSTFFGGGGMYHKSSSTASLNHCVFNKNIAFGFWGKGGGIHSIRSSSVLSECRFYMNIAQYAGGGIDSYESSIKINETIFKDNTAGYFGGGTSDWSNSELILHNCKFIGNYSTGQGGGMFSIRNSKPTLINCIFFGNEANSGGGICSRGQMYDNEPGHNTPKLYNCSFVRNSGWNGKAILAYSYDKSNYSIIQINNCIFWDDGNEIWNNDESDIKITYTDIFGGWPGEGNINVDPLFSDPNNGDYHLKSEAGRWDPNSLSWVYDAVTSRCIDAGNPGISIGDEYPDPENIRINMGAYGGTTEASRSPSNWSVITDINNDGIVEMKDYTIVTGYFGQTGENLPGDFNQDGIVDVLDLAYLAANWLKTTIWYMQ